MRLTTMRRRAAASAVLLSVAGVSGCAGGGGPDVSAEGQVAYACVLAARAAAGLQSPDDWESLEMIGESAEPAAVELAAAGSLAGGIAAFEIPGHGGISAAGKDLVGGVSQMNVGALEDALGRMNAACDQEVPERPPEEHTSAEGRVVYACALAEYVREERGDAGTWGGIGEEPALHEAGSVGALLGGLNGHVMPEAPAVSTEGAAVVRSVTVLDADGVDASLDAVISACQAR